MNSATKKAYLQFISSMMIFGTIGIFRKYIPLSSGLLAFARGLTGGIFLLIFSLAKGKGGRERIDRRNLILLAITGVAIGMNWIFLFESYRYTTVTVATMCYYMQPTILILLSPVVFREKLTPRKLACAAAAIVGMVFVSGMLEGGGIGSKDIAGIACGLLAAALYATVVILNKKISAGDAYQRTTVQLLSAAIVLLPYLLVTEDFGAVSLNFKAVVMVLIVGMLHTGIAYAMYFGSMKALKAQSIAVLGYIDPVFALLLSAILLHEKLSLLGILGAVLVIGSAVISELSGEKNGKSYKKLNGNLPKKP